MKAALIIAFLGAIGLFAEGSANASSLEPWGQLTALGIVAVVLVFIVTKMLPDLHGRFIDQSKIFADTLDRVCARDDEHQAKTADALAMLTAQCARSQVDHSENRGCT